MKATLERFVVALSPIEKAYDYRCSLLSKGGELVEQFVFKGRLQAYDKISTWRQQYGLGRYRQISPNTEEYWRAG